MIPADVADPTVMGYSSRFLFCAALTCLFLVSTVMLVVVMLRRARRD